MAAIMGGEPLGAQPHAPQSPSSQQSIGYSGVGACLTELGRRELLAHLVIAHLVVAAPMTVHLDPKELLVWVARQEEVAACPDHIGSRSMSGARRLLVPRAGLDASPKVGDEVCHFCANGGNGSFGACGGELLPLAGLFHHLIILDTIVVFHVGVDGAIAARDAIKGHPTIKTIV
jgi:hypothetical protein